MFSSIAGDFHSDDLAGDPQAHCAGNVVCSGHYSLWGSTHRLEPWGGEGRRGEGGEGNSHKLELKVCEEERRGEGGIGPQ